MAGKITAFQPVTTAFQPCATEFQTDTTTFQPITTIGSGALRSTVDAVVLKMPKNERGQNKLPAEKKENLSLLSSHTLRRNQGAPVRLGAIQAEGQERGVHGGSHG